MKTLVMDLGILPSDRFRVRILHPDLWRSDLQHRILHHRMFRSMHRFRSGLLLPSRSRRVYFILVHSLLYKVVRVVLIGGTLERS